MARELFVADMDRFLLDTDRASMVLNDVCLESGLDQAHLLETQRQDEAIGTSFDAWGYLKRLGSPALLEEVEIGFKESCAKDSILYGDTGPLLEFLDDAMIPNLVLTTGGDDWQRIKLEAAGLGERPHIITHEKHKGEMIEKWRNEAGEYQAPSTIPPIDPDIHVGVVLLGDDKAVSFEGLPADCGGYLLRRPEEIVHLSQRGEVPPRIMIVSSLIEIAQDLALQTAS